MAESNNASLCVSAKQLEFKHENKSTVYGDIVY